MSEPAPFDPILTARHILRRAGTASLGTLDEAGNPFVTLVTLATLPDGRPVLHLSDLAVHAKNLKRSPRASLLVVAPGGEGGNPLAGARITLTGTIAPTTEPLAAARYRARHGGTSDFHDFHYYALTPEASHLVAGFGRILSLAAAELFPDLSDCGDAIAGESMVVEHMNEDHGEAIALYATQLLGLPDGAWKMTASDPDGIDLECDGNRARLDFPTRAHSVQELGGHLKAYARTARAKLQPATTE